MDRVGQGCAEVVGLVTCSPRMTLRRFWAVVGAASENAEDLP